MKKMLGKSPINYFSDLFVCAMVIAWIAVIIVMVAMAVYATRQLGEVYIWSDVANLVAIPLSCGAGIWMVKNSVQHAMHNREGSEVPYDFPKVTDEDLEPEEEEGEVKSTLVAEMEKAVRAAQQDDPEG